MKIPLQILDNIVKNIKQEFEHISYSLDERRKRLWCAARAKAHNRVYGRGGVMIVHKATRGCRQLEQKFFFWYFHDLLCRKITHLAVLR